MTLYEFLMAQDETRFTRDDWRQLGQGTLTDEETVAEMLAEGYGAIVCED